MKQAQSRGGMKPASAARALAAIGADGLAWALQLEELGVVGPGQGLGGLLLAGAEQVPTPSIVVASDVAVLRSVFAMAMAGRVSLDGTVPADQQQVAGGPQRLLLNQHGAIYAQVTSAGAKQASVLLFNAVVGNGVGTLTNWIDTSVFTDIGFFIKYTAGAGSGPLYISLEASDVAAPVGDDIYPVPIAMPGFVPASAGPTVPTGALPSEQSPAQSAQSDLDGGYYAMPNTNVANGDVFGRIMPVNVRTVMAIRMRLWETAGTGTARVRYVAVE